MTESENTPKYHRHCKLNRIKECDVFFHTNIEKKIFCCDNHRYQWHNSLKSLFKRVEKLEEKTEKMIHLLNDQVGFRVKQDGEMFYPVMEEMNKVK